MKVLNCPVTGEKILTIGANGVMKRENYAEAWFVLSDGSRMRVAMSKAAKKNLTEKQADALFKGISKDWNDSIRGKVLPKRQKDVQIGRLNKLTYKRVEEKDRVMITKK